MPTKRCGVHVGVAIVIGGGLLLSTRATATPAPHSIGRVTIRHRDAVVRRADGGAVLNAQHYLGTVTTVGSLTNAAHSITYDSDDGHYYVLSTWYLERIESSGQQTQIASFFSNGYPDSVVWDGTAHVFYVSCPGGYQVAQVTPQGQISVWAGGSYGTSDGNGTAAKFQAPSGMALDAVTDTLYVADNDRMRKISASRQVATVGPAQLSGSYAGQSHSVALDPLTHDLGITDPPADRVLALNVSTATYRLLAGLCIPVSQGCQTFQVDGIGRSALFGAPAGIVYASKGNAFFVSDQSNFSVRRLSVGGTLLTVAGSGQSAVVDGTGVAASWSSPTCMFFDPILGLAVVCDSGGSFLRHMTTNGPLPAPPPHSFALRPAASIYSIPNGIARTADGSTWFAEQATGYIGRLLTSGKMHEYVLPPGHERPYDALIGTDGNVWFADYSNPDQYGNLQQANISAIDGTGHVRIIPVPDHCAPNFPTAPSLLAFSTSLVWFATSCPAAMGFAPLTGNGVSELAAPVIGGLAVDAQGHVWAGDASTAALYEYDATGRFITSYNLAADSGVAVAPDQHVWMLSNGQGTVTDLDPATGATVVYQLPSCGCIRALREPVFAPDGSLWFLEGGGSYNPYPGAAMRLSAGVFTEYFTYEPHSQPSGITFDSTGVPWIADAGADLFGAMRSLP